MFFEYFLGIEESCWVVEVLFLAALLLFSCVRAVFFVS